MGEIADALKRSREEGTLRPRRASQTDGLRHRVALSGTAVDEALAEADAEPELSSAASEPRDDREPAGELLKIAAADGSIVHDEHPAMQLCRHLAHRVRTELERRSASTLAVVSPLHAEGKSTVACNLAIALASVSRGRSVALVDLDLRRPTIASKLGLEPVVGVEQVIAERARLAAACLPVDHPELDVYAVREPQRAPHELLVQTGLAEMLSALRERYSVVIFDTPPVLLVPDANLILRSIDACIGIARIGQTRVRSFRSMVDLLPQSKIIGEIINGSRAPRHVRDYDYYYYHPDAQRDEQRLAPDGAEPDAAGTVRPPA